MASRRVLVVCSGNTCRSPMAAAYLQAALAEQGGAGIQVASAGLHALPGLPAAAEARQAVAEDGLSLAEHRSRPLDEELVTWADLILVMTRAQAEELQRRFPAAAGRVALWREWAAGSAVADPDVPDPFGQPLAGYRLTARQLRREAAAIARRLLAGEAGEPAAAGAPSPGGGPGGAVPAPPGSSPPGPAEAGQTPRREEARPMRVAIGSDHAGFALKQELVRFLEERGLEVIDVGTHSQESCDYPDFARAVCEKVRTGEAERGVLICGTGIGMAIAANKVPGIRAACCTEPYSARLTRQDNDSNVLTLGARVVGPGMAREILEVWLATPFAGGRHQRRIDKIAQMENEWMQRS